MASEPSAEPGPLERETAESLAGLDGAPVEDHPAVYDALHRRLAAALDDPPAPRPGG